MRFNVSATKNHRRKIATRQDDLVTQLKDLDPETADEFIEANTKNLTSMRRLVKALFKIVMETRA